MKKQGVKLKAKRNCTKMWDGCEQLRPEEGIASKKKLAEVIKAQVEIIP